MKERYRYLFLEFETEKFPGRSEFMGVVWGSILQLFGEYGASKTALSLIEFNSEKGYAILKCSHKALDMVRASLASITEIGGRKAEIHVIRVSGTIKSLKRKLEIQQT